MRRWVQRAVAAVVAGVGGVWIGICIQNRWNPEVRLPPPISRPRRVQRVRFVPPPAVQIIPRPKVLSLTGSAMPIGPKTHIVLAAGATDQEREAVGAFQRELARYGHAALRVVSERSDPDPNGAIFFGETGRSPLARRLLAAIKRRPSAHDQGYVCAVTPHWAMVSGHDPAGTFYGAQTLCQLLRRPAAASGPLLLTGAVVDDYPSLRWRGVHLFCGIRALPFHRKLIADVLARYKMNQIVLQCEQARWDALGGAAPSWAMPKRDLTADIAYANRHFITVTPLVNVIGHMRWLVSMKEHRDMSEDPQVFVNARVDSPETDRYLFRLCDEVQQLFDAHDFHIGGDEVTVGGRYPSRSRGRYPTARDAYMAQTMKFYRYLSARHVRTMLWGDELLGAGEAVDNMNAPSLEDAAAMRAALPKDILLVDWHYTPAPAYPSLSLLRKAGFRDIIGATWQDPDDIVAFARALAASSQRGLLQTTWAGFESRESNLRTDHDQFSAFVLAADAAWNGGDFPNDEVPYSPSAVFDDSMRLPPYP